MKRFNVSAVMLLSLAISAVPASAAWPNDPAANVPVDTLGYATFPVIVADGAGGVISAWIGSREDNTERIFAQHFDNTGQALWTANGIMVAPAGQGQTGPQIISDGAGGAIVVWEVSAASLSSDIRAQRLSGSGSLSWGDAGARVCGAPGDLGVPMLVSDGAGGAIVAWWEGGLLAQRLDPSGVRMWTVGGVLLSSRPGTNYLKDLVADGAGGAIAAWYGSATYGNYQDDVYGQRVSGEGALLWGANGVTVTSAAGNQNYAKLVSDGAEGAIVAWIDSRGGQDWATFDDIYAQRIDASGVAQWTPGGVGVCTAPGWQDVSAMISDGAGGAILVWDDARGDSIHVYAQRVNAVGNGVWTANGVGLFSTDRGQLLPAVSPDGIGGAFVAWMDHRSGVYQVYGQRLSPGGVQLWGSGGIALSSSLGGEHGPQIRSDGTSGAVVTWEDSRHGLPQLYAQGVQANGLGGGPVASAAPNRSATLALAAAGANPSRAAGFTVRFTLADSQPASMDVVDIAGRRISSLSVGSYGAGAHTVELAPAAPLKPGLYLVRLRQGGHARMLRVARLD